MESATAASAARSRAKCPVNSAARCRASAALPPLPKKMSFPPARNALTIGLTCPLDLAREEFRDAPFERRALFQTCGNLRKVQPSDSLNDQEGSSKPLEAACAIIRSTLSLEVFLG